MILNCVRGNIAMMAALFLFPLLGFVGVGVDYARYSAAKVSLQEAVDATVLATARKMRSEVGYTTAQGQVFARDFFDKIRPLSSDITINNFAFNWNETEGRFWISFDAKFETAFLKLLRRPSLDTKMNTEAKATPPGPIEAVMVLDNTGSMGGAKLDALKSSARMLTDIILYNGEAMHRIALVPFAPYVSVGAKFHTAEWINASSLPEYEDDFGSSWNGCVGSRSYPLNIQDVSFPASRVPAVNVDDSMCPQPILPLTNDKTTLENAINAMTANGNTYIAGGMSWGLRVISNSAPFTQGLTNADIDSKNGIKSIILLTDGENTRAPSYPAHDSTSKALADTLTQEACDEAKTQGIRVFTIAFEVTDSSTKTLMQSCASSSDDYFDASNSTALEAAFRKIAVDLSDLALTR